MSTRITIRVPQGLYEQAKAKAKREDITVSQVLRRALRNWVKESTGSEKEGNPEKTR